MSPEVDYTPGSSRPKRKYNTSSSKAAPIEKQNGYSDKLASSKRSEKKQSYYEQEVSEDEASDEDHVVHPKKRANEKQAEKSLDDEDISSGRSLRSARGAKPKVMHFTLFFL